MVTEEDLEWVAQLATNQVQVTEDELSERIGKTEAYISESLAEIKRRLTYLEACVRRLERYMNRRRISK